MDRSLRYGHCIGYLFLCTCVLWACYGCDVRSKGRVRDKQVALKINNYSLTVEEFNKLFWRLGFVEDTPAARKAFLDNLISRKLIVQQGLKKGVDKRPSFLTSIENFWEQSLLTILIDEKTKEISAEIGVTDEELQESYNKWLQENPDKPRGFGEMRDVIREYAERDRRKAALDKWLRRLRTRADIEIDTQALGLE